MVWNVRVLSFLSLFLLLLFWTDFSFNQIELISPPHNNKIAFDIERYANQCSIPDNQWIRWMDGWDESKKNRKQPTVPV